MRTGVLFSLWLKRALLKDVQGTGPVGRGGGDISGFGEEDVAGTTGSKGFPEAERALAGVEDTGKSVGAGALVGGG